MLNIRPLNLPLFEIFGAILYFIVPKFLKDYKYGARIVFCIKVVCKPECFKAKVSVSDYQKRDCDSKHVQASITFNSPTFK